MLLLGRGTGAQARPVATSTALGRVLWARRLDDGQIWTPGDERVRGLAQHGACQRGIAVASPFTSESRPGAADGQGQLKGGAQGPLVSAEHRSTEGLSSATHHDSLHPSFGHEPEEGRRRFRRVRVEGGHHRTQLSRSDSGVPEAVVSQGGPVPAVFQAAVRPSQQQSGSMTRHSAPRESRRGR